MTTNLLINQGLNKNAWTAELSTLPTGFPPSVFVETTTRRVADEILIDRSITVAALLLSK
ncbi:MAG TPA: hypothetical protein DD726_00375 [Phycisphaerales bacterium]|nr:hypothetical protein [Phycisphaerales bacterium]